jgi:predicted dehydrogenase
MIGLPVLSLRDPLSASPNDQIQVAIVGLGGRGRYQILEYAKRNDVRIAAVCDVDAGAAQKAVQLVEEQNRAKPKVYVDIRQLLDDRQIDVVSIATCNHWHTLATIWACQAGKDVYVEKPGSHNLFEGQQAMAAARKYQRIVQIGLQARSLQHYRRAIELVHQGAIGKVYMARGICFKRRKSIGRGVPGPVPPGVDFDLWLGPAPERPFQANRFHYNWHWFWDTGNGDIANQGVHEMDLARWALGKDTLPRKVHASGAKFITDDDQETPNTMLATFEYEDCHLVFEVRGLLTGGEASISRQEGNFIGNTFYGSDGYLSLSSEGFQLYRGEDRELAEQLQHVEPRLWDTGAHIENFLKAVRSGQSKDLNCEVAQGRLSAALCHLANISYRTGRVLQLNADEEKILNDSDAEKYTRRQYRSPFVVPDLV